MPAPIKPSEYCDLIPTASTDPCEAMKRVFFDLPAKICTLLKWIFDAAGGVSEEFKSEILPSGIMWPYGGTTAPTGWLLCNGAAYKQSAYPALFAVIGTRFGDGNGIDEFQVPNSKRRALVGWDPSDPTFDVGQTGGAETATLLEGNNGPHRHLEFAHGATVPDAADPSRYITADKSPEFQVTDSHGDGGHAYFICGAIPAEGETTVDATLGLSSESGAGDPFSIMQPWLATAMIIKI